MARLRSRSQDSQASSPRRPPPTAFCQASLRSNSSPNWDELRRGLAPMLFLTRWFGVTCGDAERSLAREKSDIDEIIEKVLLMQFKAAPNNTGRSAVELMRRVSALEPNSKCLTLPSDATVGWRRG